MDIVYELNKDITVQQFSDLLRRSTLGERRPLGDIECLKGMLANSNLIVTAWVEEELVGIARSVTDFFYCCYLSDLAVDQTFKGFGIGKTLQVKTQEQLGPRCKLILLSAPGANSYYPHIGYAKHDRCWVLDRDNTIKH